MPPPFEPELSAGRRVEAFLPPWQSVSDALEECSLRV